jgi:hypothetical protein
MQCPSAARGLCALCAACALRARTRLWSRGRAFPSPQPAPLLMAAPGVRPDVLRGVEDAIAAYVAATVASCQALRDASETLLAAAAAGDDWREQCALAAAGAPDPPPPLPHARSRNAHAHAHTSSAPSPPEIASNEVAGRRMCCCAYSVQGACPRCGSPQRKPPGAVVAASPAPLLASKGLRVPAAVVVCLLLCRRIPAGQSIYGGDRSACASPRGGCPANVPPPAPVPAAPAAGRRSQPSGRRRAGGAARAGRSCRPFSC